MTAAVRAQLLAAGVKLPTEAKGAPATPRTPAPAHSAPMKPRTPATSEEKAKREIPVSPQVAATHYIGPYQLSAANGTHFPGRMRLATVGPSDEGMVKAIVAAMQAYWDSKKTKP